MNDTAQGFSMSKFATQAHRDEAILKELDQLRAENGRLKEHKDNWRIACEGVTQQLDEAKAENLSLTIRVKKMREALAEIVAEWHDYTAGTNCSRIEAAIEGWSWFDADVAAQAALATTSHEELIAAHDAQVRRDALIEAADKFGKRWTQSAKVQQELRRMADEVKSNG